VSRGPQCVNALAELCWCGACSTFGEVSSRAHVCSKTVLRRAVVVSAAESLVDASVRSIQICIGVTARVQNANGKWRSLFVGVAHNYTSFMVQNTHNTCFEFCMRVYTRLRFSSGDFLAREYSTGTSQRAMMAQHSLACVTVVPFAVCIPARWVHQELTYTVSR
jgi:hypothetical protein